MIAVLKDKDGNIKETRETWRDEKKGVQHDAHVREQPHQKLEDPNAAPHRKDGSLRPHKEPRETIPGEGTPGKENP